MKNKVQCPICVNGSGVKMYSGRVGEGQKCEDCNGSGEVSRAKWEKLRKKYGDLIGDLPKIPADSK